MNKSKTTSKNARKSVKSKKTSSRAPKKPAPKKKQAVKKSAINKAAKAAAAKKKKAAAKEQKLVNLMRNFDKGQAVGILKSIHNVVENGKAAAAAFKAGKIARTWSLLDGILAHVDEALVAVEEKDTISAREQEDRKFLMGIDGFEHPAPSAITDDES